MSHDDPKPALDELDENWGVIVEGAESYALIERTREAAIESGRASFDGEPFEVYRLRRPDIGEFVAGYAEPLIDWMRDGAIDEWDDLVPEDWPMLSAAQVASLEDALSTWARQHCRPTWWVTEDKGERIVAERSGETSP
jgi:hypothetical protein